MKTVVLPPPRGHKHCPNCHGWGEIFQDLAGGSQVLHPCGECQRSGYVPITRRYWEPSARPSRVLSDYLARTPFVGTVNFRYCELCGDYAEPGDRRRDGLIVHADRVCSLFAQRSVASEAVVGDVVSSKRLMNHHAPVMVARAPEPALNGCRAWISRTFLLGRWVPCRSGKDVLRLVCDGPVVSRDMPAADLMPRADPSILRPEGFGRMAIPEEWTR